LRHVIFIILIGCTAAYSQTPDEFVFTTTNSSGSILGQVQIDSESASADDWIAAFDESGNCCGASQLIMNNGISYLNLVIYGDDATTSQNDEGMNGNESFSLKLYDYSSNSYLDYQIDDEIVLLYSWTNTNGAPIPDYSNPNDVYIFNAVQLEFNQSINLCENEDAVTLVGGFPSGGEYSGEGVSGNQFYPTSSGNFEITYTLGELSVSIVAVVYPTSPLEILNDGSFCTNDNEIELSSNIAGGTFYGDGIINNTLNPQLLNAGTYIMSYEVLDSNQCQLFSEKYFTVHQAPEVDIVLANNSLTANVIQGDIFNYLWSNGQITNAIDVGEASEYWLIASNDKCSSDTAQISIDNSSLEMLSGLNFSIDYSLANKELKIKISQVGTYQIEIFSLNGQKILSNQIHGTEYKAQLNYSGLSIITISNYQKQHSKKILL
jgi:hypothetical protein